MVVEVGSEEKWNSVSPDESAAWADAVEQLLAQEERPVFCPHCGAGLLLGVLSGPDWPGNTWAHVACKECRTRTRLHLIERIQGEQSWIARHIDPQTRYGKWAAMRGCSANQASFRCARIDAIPHRTAVGEHPRGCFPWLFKRDWPTSVGDQGPCRMIVDGSPGASCAWGGTLAVVAAVPDDTTLTVRISGSSRAEHRVQLVGHKGTYVFDSGWQPSPSDPTTASYCLRPGIRYQAPVVHTRTGGGEAYNDFWSLIVSTPQKEFHDVIVRQSE